MQSSFSTPRGNITTTQWVPAPMMRYGGYASPSVKYPFTIVLKNDSVVKVKGRIDIAEKHHFIKTKLNKQKVTFKPADTKEIFRIDNIGRKITGMPTDSCWLFLAVKGKINVYSYLAEFGMANSIAIQKGLDAPIVPINKKNVEEMVAENVEAMMLVQTGKLVKAITLYNKNQK